MLLSEEVSLLIKSVTFIAMSQLETNALAMMYKRIIHIETSSLFIKKRNNESCIIHLPKSSTYNYLRLIR